MKRMFEREQGAPGVEGRPGAVVRLAPRVLLTLLGLVAVLAAALTAAASAPVLAAQKPPRPAEAPAPAAEDVEEQVEEALEEAGPALRMLGRWGGGSWIGVRIEEVGEDTEAAGAYGARVSGVEDDSPAKRAGLQENDVIVSFQGERVESARALQRMVSETPAGRTVRLGIHRGGAEREVRVKLEERPSGGHPWAGPRGHGFRFEAPFPPDAPDVDKMMRHKWEWSSRPRLGVQVETLTPQLARYFGVKEGAGVLVEEVRAASAAERAGLKAGDVIVKVDDTEVGDGAELSEALAEVEEGKVTLTIVRDRAERTLEATLERPKERPRARAPRPGRPAPPPRHGEGDPI